MATATISTVSPSNGLPGTQVTIAGSGFGASQGTGQVWLGTGYGVVQSWSNTQIVAQVAAGAATGVAQVLQSGVLSTSVPFAVNTINFNLASISPVSGSAGTSVTFTGSGFGATQGTGIVWLGSKAGQVLSWNDTTVVAVVASGAVTGIARIQQGTWSKAFSYTVPGSGAALQCLRRMCLPWTGLAWTSNDPTIVSVSADNTPAFTALAAGWVAILAGGVPVHCWFH